MMLVSRRSTDTPGLSPDPQRFAADAIQALLAEVNLTPKPGLVDRRNTGAHRDMHIGTFYHSIAAIGPWLPRFIHQGRMNATLSGQERLSGLRPLGIACERHMYQATGGVNTHKGSIFSLALLCAAFGQRYQQGQTLSAASLCDEVATICQGLVSRELENNNQQQTAGQRLYASCGLRGARGQAEEGYPLVTGGALPLLRQSRAQGVNEQEALTDCLLWLMAHNDDTNVVSRGGVAGLRWLQQRSAALLAQRKGGDKQANGEALIRFDEMCIARNLSPGGSADLLIVSWLLARLPQS